MIFLSCGLEKEMKISTDKQKKKTKPIQGLTPETRVDKRLRAVEEQHVCKDAQHLGKGTHQAAGANQLAQEMDVGIEGSTPDTLVRVLSHVAPEVSLSPMDRQCQVWRC